uniref:Uncharacterized protein n=1 Tax=Caenorhabditis japonica TaxID=281687 RepID=A0A8R1DEP3_CAEJA
MPRDSGRNQSRRSHEKGRSELSDIEKKVQELERKLQKQDQQLAKDAQRLKKDYGIDVSLNEDTSRSPAVDPYLLADSDDRFMYNSSPAHRDFHDDPYYNRMPSPRFDFEPQFGDAEFDRMAELGFEQGHDFQDFDLIPPRKRFCDEVDIQVDEIPRWPMDEESPPQEEALQLHPPSFYREDVRVEPMPIFPMDGATDEDRRGDVLSEYRAKLAVARSRDERARIQMEMIAIQAERADRRSKDDRRDRKERETERKDTARKKINELRTKAILDMKEQEIEKRRIDRERRHAELKKQDRDGKRRSTVDRAPISTSSAAPSRQHDQFDSDEIFLEHLKSVFGKIVCSAERSDSKKGNEYVGSCHVINIPKEMLCATSGSREKGDAYKKAISRYVSKLVDLGVFEDKFRKLMVQNPKLRRFMAELIEPLCNDIAIFGTQISVTDSTDKKNQFITFVKEKSAEFWNIPENYEKLSEFLKTHVLGRSSSSSAKTTSAKPDKRPRRDDRSNGDRRDHRDKDGEKRRRVSSDTQSLEVLFASVNGNTITGSQQQQQQQPPLVSPIAIAGQKTSPPSLMSLPFLAPPQQGINSYNQPQMMHQELQYPSQHQQPHFHQPVYSSYPMGDADVDLMNEIFL